MRQGSVLGYLAVGLWIAALMLGFVSGRFASASRAKGEAAPRPLGGSAPHGGASLPRTFAPESASASPPSEVDSTPGFPTGPSRRETLSTLLDQFRSGLREELSKDGGRFGRHSDRFLRNMWGPLNKGLLEDENEDLCAALLGVLFFGGGWTGGEDTGVHLFQPAPIAGALKELLEFGSNRQKLAALQFTRQVLKGNSVADQRLATELEPGVLLAKELQPLGLSLLCSDDPMIQATALDILRWSGPEERSRQEGLAIRLARGPSDPGVQRASLRVLGQGKSPEAAACFQQEMSKEIVRTLEKNDSGGFRSCLRIVEESMGSATPDDMGRYAAILSPAVRAASDPKSFQRCVEASLSLPPIQVTPFLEQACVSAPTPALEQALRRTLDQIRGGETRVDRLRTAFRETP